MELWSTEFTIAIVVGVLIVGTLISKLQGRAAAGVINAMHGGNLRATVRDTFERTGFRHAALPDAPLEAQVDHSMAQLGVIETKTHLIRVRDGVTLHFEQHAHAAGAGSRISARWWTPARAAFGLHIADRRLSSVKQKLNNVFTELVREFEPLFDTELSLDHPKLNERFRVWTDDPARAKAALSDPQLYGALLALPLVDLATLESQISLNDPLMENLKASPGVNQIDAMVAGHDAAERVLHSMRRVTEATDTSGVDHDGCVVA